MPQITKKKQIDTLKRNYTKISSLRDNYYWPTVLSLDALKGEIPHPSHLVLVPDLDGIQFVPFGFEFRYDLFFIQRRLYQLHSSGRSRFLSVLSFRSRVREEIQKYCPTFWYKLCIFGNFQWKRKYLQKASAELKPVMYEATQVNDGRRKWATRRRHKLPTEHSLLVEQGRASSQPALSIRRYIFVYLHGDLKHAASLESAKDV